MRMRVQTNQPLSSPTLNPTPNPKPRALRKASAEYLTSLPFDGFAVGGALGKDREELKEVLRFTMPQ